MLEHFHQAQYVRALRLPAARFIVKYNFPNYVESTRTVRVAENNTVPDRRRESIFLPLSSSCSRVIRGDISERVDATRGEKKKFRTPTLATLPQLMRANVIN